MDSNPNFQEIQTIPLSHDTTIVLCQLSLKKKKKKEVLFSTAWYSIKNWFVHCNFLFIDEVK